MSFVCRLSLLVWAFIYFVAYSVGATLDPDLLHRQRYSQLNMLERISSQLDLLRYEIENLNLKMEISDRKIDALKNSTLQCDGKDIFAMNNETKSTFDKMRQDQMKMMIEMNLLKDNFQKILKNTTPLESERDDLPYDRHLNCIKDCYINSVSSCENVTSDGIYLIDRSTNEIPPFYAYCIKHEKNNDTINDYDNDNDKMNDNDDKVTWMIIQRHKGGSVIFNRNWEDYKHGFGNVAGDYWIGLERLRQIISVDDKTYDLWIWTKGNHGIVRETKLNNISLAPEQNGYAINWSNWSEPRDDLRVMRGNKFSTFDNDNDDDYENCARKYEAGWWYSKCEVCNLNSDRGGCAHIVHMAIRPSI